MGFINHQNIIGPSRFSAGERRGARTASPWQRDVCAEARRSGETRTNGGRKWYFNGILPHYTTQMVKKSNKIWDFCLFCLDLLLFKSRFHGIYSQPNWPCRISPSRLKIQWGYHQLWVTNDDWLVVNDQHMPVSGMLSVGHEFAHVGLLDYPSHPVN